MVTKILLQPQLNQVCNQTPKPLQKSCLHEYVYTKTNYVDSSFQYTAAFLVEKSIFIKKNIIFGVSDRISTSRWSHLAIFIRRGVKMKRKKVRKRDIQTVRASSNFYTFLRAEIVSIVTKIGCVSTFAKSATSCATFSATIDKIFKKKTKTVALYRQGTDVACRDKVNMQEKIVDIFLNQKIGR